MKLKKQNLKNKILTPAKVEQFAKQCRAKKKKVVFTNGCFDILHPGHVTYLEQARNKGDVLIVALDTDEAVRSLKGDGRPVNDLASRQLVMSALESVSAVTYFENCDPLPIIKKIKPDVLVKGGDWKIDKIVGSKEVLSWKGKVFSLPYIEGKSTTNIIKKIKIG